MSEEREEKISLFLLHVRTLPEAARKRALTRNRTLLDPDLGLSSLQNYPNI